jgi:hypothetical protein
MWHPALGCLLAHNAVPLVSPCSRSETLNTPDHVVSCSRALQRSTPQVRHPPLPQSAAPLGLDIAVTHECGTHRGPFQPCHSYHSLERTSPSFTLQALPTPIQSVLLVSDASHSKRQVAGPLRSEGGIINGTLSNATHTFRQPSTPFSLPLPLTHTYILRRWIPHHLLDHLAASRSSPLWPHHPSRRTLRPRPKAHLETTTTMRHLPPRSSLSPNPIQPAASRTLHSSQMSAPPRGLPCIRCCPTPSTARALGGKGQVPLSASMVIP